MKAIVNVVYGIGNAVEVKLEALVGAEHTIKFTAIQEGEEIFNGFIEHPVTVADIINNSNLKAALGYDNISVKVAGATVSETLLIGSGTTTLVLEDVQSTKN